MGRMYDGEGMRGVNREDRMYNGRERKRERERD